MTVRYRKASSNLPEKNAFFEERKEFLSKVNDIKEAIRDVVKLGEKIESKVMGLGISKAQEEETWRILREGIVLKRSM